MISIGIIGGTGYTGSELLRLLANHPEADVQLITSQQNPGQKIGELYPGLNRYRHLELKALPESGLPKLDVFFSCLPHGKAMLLAKELKSTTSKIIDLSADFRFKSLAAFQQWYEEPHAAPELNAEAVFGLPEIFRAEIKGSWLVANPGCYPTSILLPLIPLLKANLPITSPIICDSKSGVSGAGRNPGLKGQFVEVNENFSAYKVGHVHRHVGEIEEKLNLFSPQSVQITFTPHLLPLNRGILSTIYVNFTKPVPAEEIHRILSAHYIDEPFVRLLKIGEFPQLAQVRNSNRCDIGLNCFHDNQQAIIVSCIDNLVKGASGQAIQNMNILFNFPETLGLPLEGGIS